MVGLVIGLLLRLRHCRLNNEAWPEPALASFTGITPWIAEDPSVSNNVVSEAVNMTMHPEMRPPGPNDADQVGCEGSVGNVPLKAGIKRSRRNRMMR